MELSMPIIQLTLGIRIRLKRRRCEVMGTSRFILVLVVIFGSCTWIGTNSVWMQLPMLTSELPEGWNLPSFLSVVVQDVYHYSVTLSNVMMPAASFLSFFVILR
ncbi:hypothetical protein RB195_013954 [Necator americanus]|uniref:Riboflavin transporter n=1 Tax=Necator americanus TaxID=51031 RepID=A0ABR1DY44_NECAM